MAQAQAPRQVTIPFVGAAHAFRRKYYTATPAIVGSATIDVSPAANKIFAYGYLRSHAIKVSTKTAASTGATYAYGGVWNALQNLVIRQPGGQEMFGGPNMTGWLSYLANKQAGWKLYNDPAEYPSYSSSVTFVVVGAVVYRPVAVFWTAVTCQGAASFWFGSEPSPV